jgi:hypothetical protein
MFLTPFIDLGESLENVFGGVQRIKPNEEQSAVSTNHQELEQMESGAVHSLKPRIITYSGNISLHDSHTLQGTGIGIGSGPLDQSKAYFEVHVAQDETFIAVGAVGVHPNSIQNNYDTLRAVPNSICLPIGESLKAGDIVGIVIDISDFPPKIFAYINDNQSSSKTVSAVVRGDVWPAIEIISGSAKIVFDRSELCHLTKAKKDRGIEAVMMARSII